MTINDAADRLARDVSAAESRAEADTAKASEAYGKAERTAKAAMDRAVQKALDIYEKATRSVQADRDGAIASAVARFDVAARRTLGLDERVSVKDDGTSRMELWLPGEPRPVASAIYGGPSGWTVDGPDGREFHSQNARVRARARLWEIAAQQHVMAG